MIYLLVIVLSLLLSFYFSGTETAFISVNRADIEAWRRQNDGAALVVDWFLRKPERFIYTTLIGNNIFNVTFASLATIYLNEELDFHPEITWSVIVLLTLMLGEIIPKTVFRSEADWVARRVAIYLRFFYFLFRPFYWIVSRLSGVILMLFGYEEKEARDLFTRKDVELLLKENQHMIKGVNSMAGELFSGLLNLKELWVREAMVPRTEIVALPETATMEEAEVVFSKYGFTKVPVYRDSLDHIIGVAILKEMFLEPDNFKEMIREVLFVPETKRCAELLSEFREKNTTIAIVIDEYGGTAGLITTEDLIEELVGEIEDEFDDQEKWIRQIDEHTYSANARIETAKLAEELEIQLPEGDYETLAGFLLNRLGHIPRRDEQVELDGIQFVVTRATRRKVERVKIILVKDSPSN